MNAIEYLKTTDELEEVQLPKSATKKMVKEFDRFKWTTYNAVDVRLELREDGKRFLNITKLHKSLNFQTKTNSSGGSSWVKTNIKDKGYLKRYPDRFESVKGKGTQDFKGLYVDVDFFPRFLDSIGGLNASLWFDGNTDWFEGSVAGYVYLIVVPGHEDKGIVKYGRTINMNLRFNGYIHDAPVELRPLGVMILAFAPVDNQSDAEAKLGFAFDDDSKNWVSTGYGREYRQALDLDGCYVAAIDLFCKTLCDCKLCAPEHIQYFEPGSNIYKYKRDQ